MLSREFSVVSWGSESPPYSRREAQISVLCEKTALRGPWVLRWLVQLSTSIPFPSRTGAKGSQRPWARPSPVGHGADISIEGLLVWDVWAPQTSGAAAPRGEVLVVPVYGVVSGPGHHLPGHRSRGCFAWPVAQSAVDCLMLWKLTRVGEVGMDMARATRARMECLSCHRCHLLRIAERTSLLRKQ